MPEARTPEPRPAAGETAMRERRIGPVKRATRWFAELPEWWLVGLAIVGVAVVPLIWGLSGPMPSTVLKICIYAVMALGLNIVLGYTGQLDLGYVTFMATGAVITAVAMVAIRDPETGAILIPVGGRTVAGAHHIFHFPFSILVVMLFAGLVCALLGVLRGIPTLRLTGDYYAIVTLGIAEIIYIYYRVAAWTGGPKSISFTDQDIPRLFGQELNYDSSLFYGLVFLVFVATVLASILLRDSRFGRALSAIRLDPTAAETVGVPVNRYKMRAFAVSGFIGGVGGSLFALWGQQFSAIAVEVWESILLVCCIILGGIGSVRGALLGSVVLVAMGEVLRERLPCFSFEKGLYLDPWPQEARFLFYGVILIVIMRFRPSGVFIERGGGRPLSKERAETFRAQPAALFRLGGRPGDEVLAQTQAGEGPE